jgi:hypothetical protein
LKETRSANYVQRTEWNARDSDGTVVFSIGPVLTSGSKKTVKLAHKHVKRVASVSVRSRQKLGARGWVVNHPPQAAARVCR